MTERPAGDGGEDAEHPNPGAGEDSRADDDDVAAREAELHPAVGPSESDAERLIAAGWPVTLPIAAIAGLAVAILGTAVHRSVPPWGLVISVASALSAAVLARGLAGGAGLATYAGALLLVMQAANTVRPGGDVVVVSDAFGYSWMAASVLACAGAAFAPAGWFGQDRG